MRWFKDSLRLTHQSYLAVLKRFWRWLVVLGAISLVLDEYTFQMQKFMDQFDSPPIFLVGAILICSLTWEVLAGAVVVILACVGVNDHLKKTSTNVWQISRDTLKPLTIESLRALGGALLWSFLLVIPGIFKYIRYTFVPYVVLFEPEYQNGRVDALKRSSDLTKGHTLAVGALIAAYILVILSFYLVSQSFESSLLENPVGTVLAQIAFQLTSLYFAVFLFAIYESLNKISPFRAAD